MNIFWGVVLGVVAYLVAQLVFNDVVSGLIGIVVAAGIIFGFPHFSNRNRF